MIFAVESERPRKNENAKIYILFGLPTKNNWNHYDEVVGMKFTAVFYGYK
jgi:hypothetical protein